MTARRAPSPQAAKPTSTITIKISRTVREHITESTDLSEPIDRTLRRLLGLKITKGMFLPRPKDPEEDVKRPALLTTVRITSELHEFITKRARWNESIDTTLRRLLRIKTDGNGEAVGDGKE